MEIQTTAATAPLPAGQGSAPASLTSDFTTFLKMLTVQMQNQDPLNPTEATDFAVQLATFSGVEQQVKSNQILEQILGQFSIMSMAQFAGWVGQEARAAADVVWFDGAPVTLSPNPVATADAAVLVVRDAQGNLVAREDLAVSTAPYLWLGRDAAGAPLPSGRYVLSLESWRDGGLLAEDPVEYYGKVIEARGSAAGVLLVLEGGIEVLAAEVTALRRPEG